MEREKIESKLSAWLRKYHRAEIIKEGREDLEESDQEFHIVTSCFECRGSGRLMEGERCRFVQRARNGTDRGAQVTTPPRPTQQHDLASLFEILNGLLNTLTDVLDIRELFDRVSQVVQRVLPHDLMGVMEISEAGDRIRLHAGADSMGIDSRF